MPIDCAIYGCSKLAYVYYKGTEEKWNISSTDSCLNNATRYFYGESQHIENDNYWRYVDGEIVIW